MATHLIDTRDLVTIIRLTEQDMGDSAQMEAVAQQVSNSLLQSHAKHLLVDLQTAKYINSSMVGELIQLIKKFQAVNVSVKFCRPNEMIREVLSIICFDQLADVFDTEQDALAAFRQMGTESQIDYRSAAAQQEVEEVRQQADAGDPQAQFRLGWCLENGYGIPQNSHDAFRMYSLAAAQLLPEAIFAMATFHAYGITVPQNYEEATKLYQQAAELGLAEAQYAMAMNCDFGIGVPVDPAQAFVWYRKAAAQGHERAKAILSKSAATVDDSLRR